MDFDIIINDSFNNICGIEKSPYNQNKHILSIVNDYEDGSWRFSKFQNFIWNNIKETALSYRERQSLIETEGEYSILTTAAKNLRLSESDNVGKGSEVAEIVLYGIMKNYYKALPIVPKIFYKQNTQDQAKGSDSVHIVIESEERFSLWFGESKFYNNIENARLKKIIESVKDSISLDKIKKENSIITNLSDINDFEEISEILRTKIKNSLSQKESIDKLKTVLNIPILLLHECSITKRTKLYTDDYKLELIAFHKDRATAYFKKQIEECKVDIHLYEKINFHIILFPVANKEIIVEKFVAKAKLFRD